MQEDRMCKENKDLHSSFNEIRTITIIYFSDLPDIEGESSIQEYWARKNQIETLDFNKLTNFKNLKMLVVMHNRYFSSKVLIQY